MRKLASDMEASQNIYTAPMRDGKRLHGGALADFAIERIDTFFETERLVSEEDRYRGGLEWAKEHGWITDEQALFLERDYHLHMLGLVAEVIEVSEIVIESTLL